MRLHDGTEHCHAVKSDSNKTQPESNQTVYKKTGNGTGLVVRLGYNLVTFHLRICSLMLHMDMALFRLIKTQYYY